MKKREIIAIIMLLLVMLASLITTFIAPTHEILMNAIWTFVISGLIISVLMICLDKKDKHENI